jgi:hypothetical protein
VAVHPLRLQCQPLGALHHKHSHPHTECQLLQGAHLICAVNECRNHGTGSGYGMQHLRSFYVAVRA